MQQVRYFLALASTLNFTRAAEHCNVSQPALTRAIKGLEDELGGELIRREGRLSHLTELGQRMLPLLQQCYEGAASAKALAKSVAAGEVTALAVGVSRTVSVELIMGCLTELYAAFPTLQLKIRRGTASEIVEMLKAADVELAIAGPLEGAWDRLDAWALFTEDFELVVGADHPLAMRNDLAFDGEALRGERFLVQVGSELAEQQIARLRAGGVPVANAHEVETDRDMAALLEANLGIAVAPATAPRSAGLRRLKLPLLDLQRTVSVYAVAGRRRPTEAATLLNLLRAADWQAKLG
ncbi:MAG TPA: LysR family transcriptional regulator [Caulobacteraceae bacterium]|nr:LysR family transcriptional regulator [Caulobacteraceae bacterium]